MNSIQEKKLEEFHEFYISTESQTVTSLPLGRQHDIQFSRIASESTSSGVQEGQLNFKMEWMRDRIRELENRVEELENKIPPSGSRVIDIREVTIEEAKRMIYEYLEGHNSQSIYPSEVADELGLDLEIAVKAIDELLGEEKLEVADR